MDPYWMLFLIINCQKKILWMKVVANTTHSIKPVTF